VFRFAKVITVLVQGRVLLSGTPDQISQDSQVRDIYLGHRNHA
jgi:branched-chain amino acid transport system ATP-binding protein